MTGDPRAGGPTPAPVPAPALAPGDPGLQPERTRLAWRRTVLSLAVGCLVALRALPPIAGGWTVPLALAGLAVAVGLGVAARRRAAQVHRALSAGGPLPGALPLAALAGAVAAGAVAAGLVLVAALVRR